MFQSLFPLAVAEGGDEFAADSGDGLQQELAEIAKSDSLLLGNTSLRHEEKSLGEGAVDVGGGGEVAAKPYEGGVRGDFVARSTAFADFVVNAVLGSRSAALAAIGKGEIATVGVDFVRRLAGGHGWIAFRLKFGNDRFEKRGRLGPCEWFFCGSHMQCYR
jgi:hypothetical protein